MTNIYLIHTLDDLHKFLQRNPTITWSRGIPISIENFKTRLLPPIALYVSPNNILSWNPIESGERDLQNEPDRYKLRTISSILPLGKVFTTFLKHHNAYDKFITQDFFCTNDIPFTRLLLGTFDWEGSSEGFFYWDQLDDKWRALINTLKLNRNEVISNLLDILH
jgi:hypothetical protein